MTVPVGVKTEPLSATSVPPGDTIKTPETCDVPSRRVRLRLAWIVTFSTEFKVLALPVVMFTLIVCTPAKSGMTTSSVDVGRAFALQLLASPQFIVPAPPSHVTTASRARFSSFTSAQSGIRFRRVLRAALAERANGRGFMVLILLGCWLSDAN